MASAPHDSCTVLICVFNNVGVQVSIMRLSFPKKEQSISWQVKGLHFGTGLSILSLKCTFDWWSSFSWHLFFVWATKPHNSQLNQSKYTVSTDAFGFCLSWTVAICFINSWFLAKLSSQMSHLNSFCPSWTVALCCFRFPILLNLTSQMEHLNGFCPSCTVLICTFMLPRWVK